MTPNQRFTFDRLLAAWHRHEDLRTTGASLAELSRSRRYLDQARLDARLSTKS